MTAHTEMNARTEIISRTDAFGVDYLQPRIDHDADAVIQQSDMHYLVPVQAELRATTVLPPCAQTDKFIKMLDRAGRGRIRLRVELHQGATLAAFLDGLFAAATRKREF